MPNDVSRLDVHFAQKRWIGFGLLVIALSFAGAASSEGPAPSDGTVWLSTTSADGERQSIEVPADQVAYQIGGPDGPTTMMVERPDVQDVIVELHGAPLASQARSFGPPNRRSAAAIQAIVAAAERLDAQHDRVRQAIAGLASRGQQARGRTAVSPRIRHEYRHAYNGLALTAPGWLVEQLRANPDVAGIHPDVTVRTNLAQSVPIIRAPELHAQGLTGHGVVVGIIDTGVDYMHPDLGGGFGPGFKVIGGYDFVNRDADPRDDAGHGTHVAGIVAANGTHKGVAPGASLVAYKVLNASGSGSSSNIMAAIDRSTDPDGDPTTADALDVINLSLGGPGDPDDPMSRAIDNAAAAGVLPVISAGNSGPGYQTIGSPGTARRALTVGSTDKLDRISSFSSRGPTDKIYGIKPEVLAPGSSILSTLRGGGSGPLSGTSMAAPHVAGAAALLLEARPELSPEAVKSVLMTSARSLPGLNLYAQGAGRIDVAAASQRSTVVSPAAISFGVDDISLPSFAASATVNVTNIAGVVRQFSSGVVNTGLPAGITVTVSPSVLDLAPGATGTFGISLHVDNTIVPNVTVDPLAYVGRIRLQSDAETLHVPFAFLKGALLRFTFDRVPSLLVVRSATGQVTSRRPTSRLFTLVVPPGTYDAFTSFLFQTAPTTLRNALVVKQGIAVSTVADVFVRSTEAVHTVVATPVDEQGRPALMRLQRSMVRVAGTPFDISTSITGFPGVVQHAYSPLAPQLLVDWLMTSEPAPETMYTFTWHRAGISAGETLTNDASALARLSFRIDADPGTAALDVLRWNVGVAPQNALATGTRVTLRPPFTWDRIVMPKPPGDSFFGRVDHYVLTSAPAASDQLITTPMFEASLGTTMVSTLAFTAGPGFHATPLYATPRTSFDIGLEPYTWFGRFTNTASSVRIGPAIGLQPWLFVGQAMDHRLARLLPYELRQGDTVVRKGTIPGTGSTVPAIPVTPGRYTFTLQGPAGSLDGAEAATVVRATFDTAGTDRNPPVLSHFRIVADGEPSKAFCINERAEVRFRVSDDVALGPVQFFFRIASGQWVPWPLHEQGADMVARLPLGSGLAPNLCKGSTQAIPISLKIAASDAQGNVLETEMAPAYARLLPRAGQAPMMLQTP